MKLAKKPVEKELWITNISKNIVGISDLQIYIKPFASINILDKKHYKFSEEQIEKSITSGSVFKNNKIVVRKIAPETLTSPLSINYQATLPSRQRSAIEIKEENYDELNISDEQFVDQITAEEEITSKQKH